MITPLREPLPPPRIVPTNTEAEQRVLGAMLCDNRLFDYAEILRPEHFVSYAVHGRIFEAVRQVIERGAVADPVTLKPIFDQDPALAEIGGARYLMQLAVAGATTVIEVKDYALAVYECYMRREIIALGEEEIAVAYRNDPFDPPHEQIERLEAGCVDWPKAAKPARAFSG